MSAGGGREGLGRGGSQRRDRRGRRRVRERKVGAARRRAAAFLRRLRGRLRGRRLCGARPRGGADEAARLLAAGPVCGEGAVRQPAAGARGEHLSRGVLHPCRPPARAPVRRGTYVQHSAAQPSRASDAAAHQRCSAALSQPAASSTPWARCRTQSSSSGPPHTRALPAPGAPRRRAAGSDERLLARRARCGSAGAAQASQRSRRHFGRWSCGCRPACAVLPGCSARRLCLRQQSTPQRSPRGQPHRRRAAVCCGAPRCRRAAALPSPRLPCMAACAGSTLALSPPAAAAAARPSSAAARSGAAARQHGRAMLPWFARRGPDVSRGRSTALALAAAAPGCGLHPTPPPQRRRARALRRRHTDEASPRAAAAAHAPLLQPAASLCAAPLHTLRLAGWLAGGCCSPASPSCSISITRRWRAAG